MQSALEKRSIEERNNEIVRSDYNYTDQYSVTHKNAQSDGDGKGKGTNSGGHTHFLPNADGNKYTINYSNFDTENGGNKYDIEGRNDIGGRKKALASSLYNKDYQYGAHLINTDENQRQGQFVN
jgi:hypothetical protein